MLPQLPLPEGILSMQHARVMKEHIYFVHVMSRNSGTLYIGMTNSIYGRVLQHKEGEIEEMTRLWLLEQSKDPANTEATTNRARHSQPPLKKAVRGAILRY